MSSEARLRPCLHPTDCCEENLPQDLAELANGDEPGSIGKTEHVARLALTTPLTYPSRAKCMITVSAASPMPTSRSLDAYEQVVRHFIGCADLRSELIFEARYAHFSASSNVGEQYADALIQQMLFALEFAIEVRK